MPPIHDGINHPIPSLYNGNICNTLEIASILIFALSKPLKETN